MQIDPKLAIWLNAIYVVLTGITAPSLQAAGIANATQVVAIAALIAMPLNFLLHGLSSGESGPLVPSAPVAPPAPVSTTIVGGGVSTESKP